MLFGQEECKLLSSEPFGYTGDISGKRVYTKEEYTYECTDTQTKRGECKQWEEKYEDYNVSDYKGDIYYESENFQGSIGSIFATAQAYDKINGIWSGWKGICVVGADDGNWDWLSDPYVLGQYALSAMSAGAGTYLSSSYSEMVNYGVCAGRAGLDVGQMMEEYNNDDYDCDPVDEICGEDNAANDNTNIFTISENEYNEMISNNPDMEAYVEIIDGVGTGVLTLRVLNPSLDTTNMESAEAREAQKKVKETTLKVRAAMTTVQLASCVKGYDTGGNSDSESLTSASSIATMALSSINPMLGMAASIVLNAVDSLTSKIDTCHNEDDAKEKGSRHEATYHATKYDLCHLINVEESGKSSTNTKRTTYRYCCYDSKLTKVLVEQSKAQFAKDWQHCTDITLKELQVISFSSCDPSELDAGINGVNLDAFATTSQRMKAYQFTHKCIDTREIIADMVNKYGGKDMLIDDRDVKELLEELK
ncbi:hypothetical protein [Sulfurimonas sp.]